MPHWKTAHLSQAEKPTTKVGKLRSFTMAGIQQLRTGLFQHAANLNSIL
jgi:hypothetical protein